jgi:hypothetical protein
MPTKCGFVDAPAVSAPGAVPGDSTVLSPGPELPAATAATTPAATAPSVQSARKSCGPWTFPPMLMLITSTPSATESSIARQMSWLNAEPPKAMNPVDDPDLDPGTCGRLAAEPCPESRRVDQPRADRHRRPVGPAGADARHARTLLQGLRPGAVRLDGDRVRGQRVLGHATSALAAAPCRKAR